MPSSTGRAAGHSFERLGSSMRSSADGGSTSGWTTARAYSRRSTYTSDAIFVSWCGLHGNDREHANENFNVAAWMTFARGSPPTTGVERGGMPTHATCATRSRCLSSNNTDSTASSRCAESPSTTNSETAGCRTARPVVWEGARCKPALYPIKRTIFRKYAAECAYVSSRSCREE